jgi:hypothetical protein
VYRQWAEPEPAYVPGNGPGFDALVRAADSAAKKAGDDLYRVRFTPGMESRLLKQLYAETTAVKANCGPTVNFKAVAVGPFEARPWAPGWRLLGRCLAWQVRADLAADRPDGAVDAYLAAVRFGRVLSQGDAETLSLGSTIADDARRELLAGFATLPRASLDRLARGTAAALGDGRSPATAVQNQRKAMLLAVQWLQDVSRRGDFESLEKTMGRDVREAVAYLRRLPEPQRPAYFEGLAEEAGSMADHWSAQAGRPVADRSQWSPPAEARPWRRFSRHLFGGLDTAVEQHDRTLARTRLLGVTAWALAAAKSSGAAPTRLAEAPAALRADPYSGGALAYRASGPEFKVYSVGADLRDDGGQTDEAGEQPDLGLEPVR